MTPNGEVERPRRSAGLATRAHNLFQRPRRPTTHASRPVPTLVRGRPHQPTVRARNLRRKPKLADAITPKTLSGGTAATKRSHWRGQPLRPSARPAPVAARARANGSV